MPFRSTFHSKQEELCQQPSGDKEKELKSHQEMLTVNNNIGG
jgi:hypothetical protein